MPPELVRVRNTSDKVFKDRYANIPYTVPPGESVLVQWAAAKLWFGDPYLVDKPTMSQYDRQDEVLRVEARLGCYDGDDHTRMERFTWNRPHVEVSTLDGDLIPMLVEEMDGSGQAPEPSLSVQSRPDERQALAEELDRMKRVQAELLQRLQVMEAGNDSFAELPTDNPTKIPVDEGAI